MPTIEELKTRAARFKSLSAKLAEGDKKDPRKARHFKKLMKRVQRKALPLKRAVAKEAAAKAKEAEAKAKAAESKPAEAAS